MITYTTKAKKDEILRAIIDLFSKANRDYGDHPDDMYLRGRESIMLDLLRRIEIYEKEN